MRLGQGTAGARIRVDVLQVCGVAIVAWWARECQAQPASSWIVATANASASSAAPPSCPSYCLNALSGDVKAGILVGLWWCQGTTFPNERWSFDGVALSIVNTALTSSFCLDIADPTTSANRTGSSGLSALLLSNCTPSSASQQWAFEPGTLRLKSLAGFNSSNSLYVFAYRPPGQLNYYLYLTENATNALSFTMVDSSVMASYYSPALPQRNDSNLILNGNLELLTTYAPLGLPLEYTFFPNQQIVEGFDFVLCHWAVQADLTFGNCTSDRCSLPAEWCSGSNTDETLVFLNWQPNPPPPRPGSIMQTVPTYPGSTYLLMFDMRNPFKQMQKLQVSVSPVAASTSSTGILSQRFQILSNQTDSQTHQLRFTASGGFVNVSFISQDSTECGPLINNIQLYYWPEEDGIASIMLERGNHRKLLVAVIVGWLVAAGCAVAALFFAGKAWHTRRRRKLANTMDGMLSSSDRTNALQPKITVYSYEQLKSYTQDFSILIGEGGFGKVYFGRLPESGLRIAVKRQNAAEDAASFQMEVELLSQVHHRYIVKFFGYCNDEGERMLVFEYMPSKSLYSRLHAREEQQAPLSWAERMRIAYQVAYALEYLHHGANPPVLHRDVKSANVLLANTLTAKLADLGISKVGRNEATHWTSTMTVVKGSRGYLDPYYLQTSMISQKSDVYSFGVLLLELVTGRKAITADLELLTSWVKQKYWDQCSTEGASLAQNVQLEVPQQNILDARLRDSVRGSDVEVVMEIARCCLHEEPRHRPSMVEVSQRLRDVQLVPSHADGHLGDVDFDNDRMDVDESCSASTDLLAGPSSANLTRP